MAGHSKWANIKHRKGARDAKRSRIFTRIIKELTVAVKESGTDTDTNPRLRTAMQNAKGANMPKDTIERTIKKASGTDGTSYEEVTFEGYASSGVAVFVECTTDNNNRTVANIRAIFSKYGGNLGTNGSLEFIFDRKGVFTIDSKNVNMDLEELEKEETIILIYTNFADFSAMQKKLEELKIEIHSAELQRIPRATKPLNIEKSKSVLKMIDKFEEDDDVQNVFHNLEMTKELMQAFEEK
jgi:YebC/PmpR family DNA-binding regulatory protein